jgi:hypothetical protein
MFGARWDGTVVQYGKGQNFFFFLESAIFSTFELNTVYVLNSE